MRVLLAIAASLLVHAAIFAAAAFLVRDAPRPDAAASLRIARVELSLSEAEQENDDPLHESLPPQDGGAVRTPQLQAPPRGEGDAPAVRDCDEAKALAKPEDPPRERIETPPRPRRARVDAPPKPVHGIRPDYPPGARRRGEQGDVVVEIEVDAKGVVTDAHTAVSCGFPELDAAAVKAVKSAAFTPAASEGRPVASRARLTVGFRIK